MRKKSGNFLITKKLLTNKKKCDIMDLSSGHGVIPDRQLKSASLLRLIRWNSETDGKSPDVRR